MNLITEYCNRHNTEFLIPTNNGVLFFNDYKRPALICLTSNTPKAFTACPLCASEETLMTVELFAPGKDSSFTHVAHHHVHPDTDLLQHINKQAGIDLKPVRLTSSRDMECWLWSFFLFHHRLRRSRNWMAWREQLEITCEVSRTYAEMTHCAVKFPRYYANYYTIYQTFTVGRKYLYL